MRFQSTKDDLSEPWKKRKKENTGSKKTVFLEFLTEAYSMLLTCEIAKLVTSPRAAGNIISKRETFEMKSDKE